MSFNQHIWSKQEVISGAGKRVWECQHSCIPSTNIHCLPETAPLGSLYALAAAESLSRVRFFATPWTAAHQAPLAMGFSRQEYWSGVPLPSPPWSRSYSFMITSTHPQQYLRIAIGLDTMILSLVIKDKYMNIHAHTQIQLSQKW